MPLTTATIRGAVPLPDSSAPGFGAYISFHLTGWDTDLADNATVLNAPVTQLIGSDGEIEVRLWPNDRGLRGSHYRVSVTVLSLRGKQTINLGLMEVPGTGTYNLEDLLGVIENDLENTWQELAEAVAEAQAAAAAANAARDDAADFAGYRQFKDLDTLKAAGLTYDDVSESDIIRTRAEGFCYSVANEMEVAPNLTMAGGVKLYVLRNAEGNFPVDAFGAAGDKASDDTSPILAAIDACNGFGFAVLSDEKTYAFGGGTAAGSVRLKGGTLELSGDLKPGADALQVIVERCRLNCADNVGLQHDGTGSVLGQVKVTDCEFRGGQGARFIAGAVDVEFFGNVSTGLRATAGNKAIALQVGRNDDAVSEATKRIRVFGNAVNGVTNDDATEIHGFLLYGEDISVFGNNLQNVYHAAETACEAIYTKGVRTSITGNTIVNCGPSNDGCITCKGNEYGSSGAPEGHENTVSGNTISYTNDKTTKVVGIAAPIENVTIGANTLFNTFIRLNNPKGVLVQGNTTIIDADGYLPSAFEQESGDASWIGNSFRVTVSGLNDSLLRAGYFRGVDEVNVKFFENVVDVEFLDVTTGGATACCAVHLWASNAPLTAAVKRNEFNVSAPVIDTTSRVSAIFASGTETLTATIRQNEDNHRVLNNNASGSNVLNIEGNRSPLVPITTANVGLSAYEFNTRVTNIDADAKYRLNLPDADVGRVVKIQAQSRSFGIDVRTPSDAWEDGTTTDRTLAASGTVVLECFESGYWTPTSLVGTFS